MFLFNKKNNGAQLCKWSKYDPTKLVSYTQNEIKVRKAKEM